MSLVMPIIHINGTSRESLCEDYENARQAVVQAIEAIHNIEFNARDYAMGQWPDAVEQRKEIYRKLNEVEEFLMTHAIQLS